MKFRTKQIGTKTGQHTGRLDLVIENKDPNFDYAFCRLREIEDGGGITPTGFEPVGGTNSNDETWAAPYGVSPRAGKGQMKFQDTILCRRPKETTRYFKEREDEAYNAQIRLVQSASKRANGRLRQIDPGLNLVNVQQELKGGGRFRQKTGPTELEEVKEE